MKCFSLYYSLLEQTPSTPPANNPEKQQKVAPEVTDSADELTTEKTKLEAWVTALWVVDKKLENLETGHKSMAEIMASKTNLHTFLTEWNSKLDRPVAVEKLINDVEWLFEKAVSSYCKLSPSESKHMATGIVCSFIDSVTYALNTPVSTESKTNKKWEKADQNGESKFGMLKVFGEVAGNLLGKAKDGKELNLVGMESIFTNIEWAFGSYEVLEQRTKSIFVLMELTRKAKWLFINPATWTSKESLDRNGRIANDPNKFVTATRILETAYKWNKDVVKPEYMNAKSDFLQVLDLTDSNTKPPKSAKLNLLQLLWLQWEWAVDERFVVSDYFADLSPDAKRDPEVAKWIISWLQKAVEFGDEAIKNRDHNKTAFLPMKKQTNDLLESFKPLLGDENDPDSLYSTFKKWINLFWGVFTGESFDEVKYDDSDLESNAAANVAAWVDFSTMSEDGKTLLDQFTSWSVAWHAANVIFVQESALRYNAINAEDNNGISIWPMQWNDNRCRNIFSKVLTLPWWENLIKSNIGQEFLSYIAGDHKSDRSRDISNRWVWKRDPKGVFTLEDRKDWLEEWKNADIMNKLLIFLNTPELKWIMNEQIKSDISEWEVDDGNGNVKSYMNVLWKDIMGLGDIDSASDDQKKALVLCSRLYNANPAWTMSVLRQALRENNIGLDNLKALFSKEGRIKWSTPDWSYDHNEIVDKTIVYCNACIWNKEVKVQTTNETDPKE